jgi:hypothetical protein
MPVAKQNQVLAQHAHISGDIDGVTTEADRVLKCRRDPAACAGRARQERNTFFPSAGASRTGRDVKLACLAPSVALR